MARAIPCPCSGPKISVRSISRSSVPCRSSRRSCFRGVDILPEYPSVQVKCQPKTSKSPQRHGGKEKNVQKTGLNGQEGRLVTQFFSVPPCLCGDIRPVT